MLTLNQIISQITDLANAHYQIAEVGTGTLAELQSKPDRLYPLLWLSNEGGSLDQNYKIDNIRLTMFGRVIAGEEGQDDDASELEVLSDMQLILLDFLNYFHQQHGQEYVTDKAATLEHFTERTNDRTAGYSCVLELKQFYDWNKCQIPQGGASIPPSVDGLTLYDFCDQATIDRLTPAQVACLEAEFGNCADATVQLNGTTVGTIPSGDSDSFTVNLDGSPSGSWDGTAWQVTSLPCDDATVQLNGVEMTTIPSGDTENITVLQSSGATQVGSKQGTHWRIDDSAISINGSPVSDVKAEDSLDIDVTQGGLPVGSWDGSAWIVPPCAIQPSITVGIYSDAGFTNPITAENLGETAYVKAVASNFTPIDYLFFYECQMNALYPIYHGANDNSSWVINGAIGNGSLFGAATDDGDTWYAFRIDFEIEGVVRLLDNYPNFLLYNSLVARSVLFSDPLVALRRSSDNATADFTPSNAVDPPIVDLDAIASNASNPLLNGLTLANFVTTDNGLSPAWYDQSSNGHDMTESTAGDQPLVVDAGAMVLPTGDKFITSNGTTHHYSAWLNTTAPLAFQSLSGAISMIWKGEIVATSASGFTNWRPSIMISEFRKNAGGTDFRVPFAFGIASSKFGIGLLQGTLANSDTFTSTMTPSLNTTYVVVITIDVNTVKIYVDGVLDSTHTIVNSTGNRSVGTNNSTLSLFERTTDAGAWGANLFKGETAEYGVYNGVLTPAEVLDIYTNYLN